jgi:F-type H+-transporting ATPase subunit b
MLALSTIMATESASNGNVLQTLGIDVKLLVFQAVGFIILVWLMSKYVFPALIKAIDERQKTIETGLKEAAEAHKALEAAEYKADDVLIEARQQAEELLRRSHEEAADLLLGGESKAKERADQIVAGARTTLAIDVRKAREALKKDMVTLVAAATERVVGEKVDADKDSELIAKAIASESK